MDVDRLLSSADRWDRKYKAALSEAIRRHEAPSQAEDTIRKYLGIENRHEFSLVNPHSTSIFRRQLLLEVIDVEQSDFTPGITMMLASFVDREWACCDRTLEFDYARAKQKVRNAMVGRNFLGVFEAAFYPETKLGDKWKSRQPSVVPLPCRSLGDQSGYAASPPAANLFEI
ncbi:MAG: hypothetical protein JO220_16075 [Hyphomicrobiales bacterium]|nr:hypothetical protein [Hyphomicrobiales bacterium]